MDFVVVIISSYYKVWSRVSRRSFVVSDVFWSLRIFGCSWRFVRFGLCIVCGCYWIRILYGSVFSVLLSNRKCRLRWRGWVRELFGCLLRLRKF